MYIEGVVITIQITDLKNPFVILRNRADIHISAIWLTHDLVQTPIKSFCMAQLVTQHLLILNMILKSQSGN